MSENIEADWRALKEAGDIVGAVKLYRQINGVGILEALHAVRDGSRPVTDAEERERLTSRIRRLEAALRVVAEMPIPDTSNEVAWKMHRIAVEGLR